MRNILFQLMTVVTLMFSMVVTANAAETYLLDPEHSYVLFHINHFGFSNPSGKWMVSGTLKLDQANPKNSKVDAAIDIAMIDTGIKELDKHLNGELFFNTAKYPKATFVSDSVTVIGKNHAKVHGILTLHGVSKPVTLDVVLNKSGVNPINDKMTAGFSAKTQLKRSDFGMTSFLPGLSDNVTIDIEAEAYQEKQIKS